MRGYLAKADRRTSGTEQQSGAQVDARPGVDAGADTDVRPANGSSKAASLLQLRAALDQSPAVKSQIALQRALDQRAAGGKAPQKKKPGREKPALQMKGIAINDDTGLEHEATVMGARAHGGSLERRIASIASPAGFSPSSSKSVLQRVDTDLTNPKIDEEQDEKKKEAMLATQIADAQQEAIRLAVAFAKTMKPHAELANELGKLVLTDFQITQTEKGHPVEWVLVKEDGQVAKNSNSDNRRSFHFKIDMDDPPASSTQKPHVGYTMEVRKVGADAKETGREIGHVWVNKVPAGRAALNAPAAALNAQAAGGGGEYQYDEKAEKAKKVSATTTAGGGKTSGGGGGRGSAKPKKTGDKGAGGGKGAAGGSKKGGKQVGGGRGGGGGGGSSQS
jgi:hypothetical protein